MEVSGVRLVVRTRWLHHRDLGSILRPRTTSISGSVTALTAADPDRNPGLDPEVVTLLDDIADARPIFQSRATGSALSMSDWTRHEHSLSRQANRNYLCAHRRTRHSRH